MHNLSSFVQITGENIVVKVLALCLDVVRPQYMVTSIHGNSYYNFPKDVYFSKKSLERLRVFVGFFFFCMLFHCLACLCSRLLHQNTQNGRYSMKKN